MSDSNDEVARDKKLLEPYLTEYSAWREFGWWPTCTNKNRDHTPCSRAAESIIAFVRPDGGVDISTFCEEHGRRVRAVLRTMPLTEQPCDWFERPEESDEVMPGDAFGGKAGE